MSQFVSRLTRYVAFAVGKKKEKRQSVKMFLKRWAFAAFLLHDFFDFLVLFHSLAWQIMQAVISTGLSNPS